MTDRAYQVKQNAKIQQQALALRGKVTYLPTSRRRPAQQAKVNRRAAAGAARPGRPRPRAASNWTARRPRMGVLGGERQARVSRSYLKITATPVGAGARIRAMSRQQPDSALDNLEIAAGNGLLHRRAFLTGGAALAAAITGYTLSDTAAAQQLTDAPWSTRPGIPIPEYATPSAFEKPVVRTLSNPRVSRARSTRAPAPPAERHVHAQRPALRDLARRRARHRPGAASPRDSRPRETAARVHARCPRPLPDGVADGICRVRWQQRAALFEPAGCRPASRRCTASCRAPSGRA